MAEYSRIAQGSFACLAQQQVVYLPFVPSYVRVTCMSGSNTYTAGAGTVSSLEWMNSMNQGDGIIMLRSAPAGLSASTPTGYFYPVGAVATSGAGSGITTFSAGLSLQFGAQIQIASITKASPAVVTTASNHGYTSGDIVQFEGLYQSSTTGMPQICGMSFQVTVTGATTFTIPWNTNQSNYTALSGSPSGAYVSKILYPFLYAPGVSYVSAITLGTTTTVSTTAPHNLVVGQEVALRIPSQWGTIQLNSLPNSVVPGSPIYGFVTSVVTSTQVLISINSSSFTAFNSNIAVASVPGLSFPQLLAVGDVNSGGVAYNGGALYPSPVVNGVSTINGPGISGSFVNNTRMGFIIGAAILTPGAVGTSFYFWEAKLFDYNNNLSSGITVA